MKIRKRQHILVILAIVMIFILCGCEKTRDSGIFQGRKGTGITQQEETEQISQENETELVESVESALYIISKIDIENKIAFLEKVSSGKQLQYDYHTGTKFLDKFGDTKAMTSFLPGDVVSIILSENERLETVQLSGEVWVYDDVTNFTIDEDIHAFSIGKSKYSYEPKMKIFSGDTKVEFSNIGKEDVLRAVVIDKKLISLAVTKGHGYLKLSNTKIFEGSFICVGDKIFKEVTKNMQIEVPEGKYLVTVANDGYGGSREVVITRDQFTSLNLDELKGEGPKMCKITFDVSVEGAVLKIDGKKADYSKPVEVRYGVHTITVEAEGYDAVTEKLVVNSKEAEIEIALTSSSKKDTSDDEKEDEEDKDDKEEDEEKDEDEKDEEDDEDKDDKSNESSNNTTDDSGSTDYLTTLYNLLTSINDNNNSTDSLNIENIYDDLSDG